VWAARTADRKAVFAARGAPLDHDELSLSAQRDQAERSLLWAAQRSACPVAEGIPSALAGAGGSPNTARSP
jgi:hypothetical protein